jgi:RNA polymerase sigma factor (sigma-70 family)
MKNLSPRDRLFMKLHFDQGLSAAEVAAAMQVSVENVYTIKNRAIQRLKTQVALAVGQM